jgi:crotonobetainyl-CoA:carnitine CoA-transferase CaiB-like acyl-CoA transferase
VANEPQLLYREMIIDIEQRLSGRVKMPGSVFKLSKTPGYIKYPAPTLGEYNRDVYSGILGYNEEEIRELQRDGII